MFDTSRKLLALLDPPSRFHVGLLLLPMGVVDVAVMSHQATVAVSEVAIDEPFEFGVGKVATISDENLSVHFERVVSDSRCPVNVTCVWEGDAIVAVELEKSGNDATSFELHTQANFPGEASYLDYRVRLLTLAPQPEEDSKIPADKYIATLVVSRR